MNSNHIFSIYIPVVSSNHNELTMSVELAQYGIVDRIDFKINKNNKTMSAFVYFTSLETNELTKCNLKEEIFYRESNGLSSYKHFLQRYDKPTNYWIMLRNRRPVKNTLLNIHQLAEELRIYRKIINEQKNRIDQLETWKHTC